MATRYMIVQLHTTYIDCLFQDVEAAELYIKAQGFPRAGYRILPVCTVYTVDDVKEDFKGELASIEHSENVALRCK